MNHPLPLAEPRIAVIGAGGAKAVAIAAKAAALSLVGCPVRPQIVIYEHREIGHLWGLEGGYSDGAVRICTSPFRDLGFPYWPYRQDGLVVEDAWPAEDFTDFQREEIARRYSSLLTKNDGTAPQWNTELFPGVAAVMKGEFSLDAWLLDPTVTGGSLNLYKEFVDAGLPNLMHHEFQRYLQWAFSKAAGRLRGSASPVQWIKEEVTCVEQLGPFSWTVKGSGKPESFTGVVVTGIGDPRLVPIDLSDRGLQRTFDAKSFWTAESTEQLTKELKAIRGTLSASTAGAMPGRIRNIPNPRVIISGGGGAAAAIAGRLRRLFSPIDITIVGKNPTMPSRNPWRFTDMYYGNDERWTALFAGVQEQLAETLGSGMIWSQAAEAIEAFDDVQYVVGKVTKVSDKVDGSITDDPSAMAVEVKTEFSSAYWPDDNRFDVFINANGFDNESAALNYLSADLQAKLKPVLTDRDSNYVITPSLEIEGYRGLHIPNAKRAAIVNPAAPNLMALGWFSTAVLAPYMHLF